MQEAHDAEPVVAVYVPAAQAVHEDAPAEEYVPIAQEVHEVELVVPVYVPAAQLVQDDAPAAE